MKRAAFVLPLIACLASVIICLIYSAVRPQLPNWWREHGGSVPYVMFWILLWFTLLPNRRWVTQICVACVLATCCLEFFQLYQGPDWLQDFRRSRLGAAWLGRGFDWNDLPPYFIGGIFAWGLGWGMLKPKSRNQATEQD